MLWAEATSTLRWKYAVSVSSWRMPANWRFVVERLMLITSKPSSTAHRRPARSTPPLPVNPAPSTRTLTSSQSGASDRTIPAQAVPCPQRSPSTSSATTTSSPGPTETATERCTSPTSGCPESTPLSRMQTRTPFPVEPPQAQSRVTSPGHSKGSSMRSAPPAGRLQAGRSSSAGFAPSWAQMPSLDATARPPEPARTLLRQPQRASGRDARAGRLRSRPG